MERAYTWNEAFHMARKEYGHKVKVSKRSVGRLPRRFSESSLSLPLGAQNVYRDQSAQDSLQIREYDHHYTVQMDRYNPEEGQAMEHAVTDALPYTLAAVGIGAAAILGGSGG